MTRHDTNRRKSSASSRKKLRVPVFFVINHAPHSMSLSIKNLLKLFHHRRRRPHRRIIINAENANRCLASRRDASFTWESTITVNALVQTSSNDIRILGEPSCLVNNDLVDNCSACHAGVHKRRTRTIRVQGRHVDTDAETKREQPVLFSVDATRQTGHEFGDHHSSKGSGIEWIVSESGERTMGTVSSRECYCRYLPIAVLVYCDVTRGNEEHTPRSTETYAAPIVPDKVYKNGPLFCPSFGPETTKSIGKSQKCLGTRTSKANSAVAAGVPLKYQIFESSKSWPK